MSTTAHVAGHNLVSEGAPHDELGRRIYPGSSVFGTGGLGRALCSCGTKSEELPSSTRRKSWHRAHKTVVLLGRLPDTQGSGS